MNKRVKKKVVIIGCGNVAWHIAKHLNSLNKFNIWVYNHKENALLKDFKTKLNCQTEVGLEKVIDGAGIYIICVTDKYISGVSEKLHIKNPNALLLHTSGSAKLSDLGNRIQNKGVFYPLQTFSKDVAILWKQVPVIVEGDNAGSQSNISGFAGLFSSKTLALDYKRRLKLHLAAVLVNNFTNALYVSAFDLINEKSKNKTLDFSLLIPLIEQTTVKIKTLDPRKAQTGPAKRKDETVMKKHLDLISKQTDLKKIYKQLSKLIVKQQ